MPNIAFEEFDQILREYIQDVQRAAEKDQAEAQIVGVFRTFISKAFGIPGSEMTQEDSLRLEELKRTGRTDLRLQNLVFEFKRAKYFDVTESSRNQLRSYVLQLRQDLGQEFLGIFTDGLRFEAYRLNSDLELEQFDKFNLADPELPSSSAFISLDAYLFTQVQRPPVADDVVRRFGSTSPTFARVAAQLKQMLAEVQSSPMLETWRDQWQRLISRVYGSAMGDDELFIRHTYLCQFARLLGYAALHQNHAQMPKSDAAVAAILDGSALRLLVSTTSARTIFTVGC